MWAYLSSCGTHRLVWTGHDPAILWRRGLLVDLTHFTLLSCGFLSGRRGIDGLRSTGGGHSLILLLLGHRRITYIFLGSQIILLCTHLWLRF